MKNILIRILQLIVVVFVIRHFWNTYHSLSQIQFVFPATYYLFLISCILLACGIFLIATPSFIWLNFLGIKISFKKALSLDFFSEIAKYLPFGIWIFISRIYLYSKLGLRKNTALFVLNLEIGIMCLITFFFAKKDFLPSFISNPWLIAGISILLIYLFYKVFHIEQSIKSFILPFFCIFLVFIIFWLLFAFAFNYLITYFTGQHLCVWEVLSIYTLAWLSGFLAFFMPAGLGVREVVLLELLTPLIGIENAFMISIISRVWWLMVEWILILIFSGGACFDFLKTGKIDMNLMS